jgi:hypothetical protein
MGNDIRSSFRTAFEDLAAGIRSVFGLEPNRELINELLEGRGDCPRVRERPRTPPRRRRRSRGRSPLVVVK